MKTPNPQQIDAPASQHAPATAGARRPYQKPGFRSESVFETMALACGKISTTQQQCQVQSAS